MTRNTLKNAGYAKVETRNGGILTANNAMSDESKKAQRTFMFSGVTATTIDGDIVRTSKGRIFGDAIRNNVKRSLHKIADKL